MESNVNIVIICGGFSSERDISFQSSKAVAKTLVTNGYKVFLLDISSPENIIKVSCETKICFPAKTYTDFNQIVVQKLITTLSLFDNLKIFIGLHGGEGENGKLQSLFDLCGFYYTGSSYKASAICMDKILCKVLANEKKIPTARFKSFSRTKLLISKPSELKKEISTFGYPVVFKANEQGSSVGVYILKSFSDFEVVYSEILAINDNFLLEEYIKGREVSIPIIKGKSYPIVEIKPNNGFYDYEHKYTDGITEHICPADLTLDMSDKISSYAKVMYETAGCSDYSRIDFIIDGNNTPCFLEINTLPGMTQLSLTPESAKAAGMNFITLLKTILGEI